MKDNLSRLETRIIQYSKLVLAVIAIGVFVYFMK